MRAIIFILVLMFTTTSTAQDNNKLPDSMDSSAGQLILCAEVPLKVMGLISIGNAGLYLSQCSDYKHVTYDIPQQYSVHFNRDAKAEKLRELAMNSLQDNFTEDELAELTPAFSCVYDAYLDAAKDDRVDTLYIPGSGLRLSQDDKALAVCEFGSESAGFFRIWFGQKPFNKKLRNRLMNGAKEAAEKVS